FFSGRVSIGLEKKGGLLVFGISDDGIGFDPEQVVSLERSERGVGLASMRERTELTGGHFFISSGRQTGTTIRIVWSLALGEQRVSP
ncbi:MAG: ATP-binding protein, partial [Desulfobacterales bacterium]